MTIRQRFKDAKPRAELARKAGISAVYAHDIAVNDVGIGSVETLALVSRNLGIAEAEIGESVLEMYPADAGAASTETLARVSRALGLDHAEIGATVLRMCPPGVDDIAAEPAAITSDAA